jgi:hypothetical protein
MPTRVRSRDLRGTLDVLAILAGAVPLLWPAFANGYPILFTDTHAFLVQASQPRMVWDKPAIYGPFLLALHGRTTLWLPAVAQALLLSQLLWLTAKAFSAQRPVRHLALCAVLAAGSAAPWFVALLMPDITAPMAVLCIFLLGFGDRLRPLERGWAGAVGTFCIASHLSLLIVAAACLVVVLALQRRRAIVAAAPLLAALALLLLTNLVGFGIAGISPYGSVFLLARLSADGPVRDVLAAECPDRTWHLCAWQGRLPPNSDDFLWNQAGPVWTTPGGPMALAPEASAIVMRAILREPIAVARAMLENTFRQLTKIRVGDTLRPDGLEQSVVGSLRAYFPAVELQRFEASLQARGELTAVATPFAPVHATLLVLGALATLAILLRPRDPRLTGLAALILAALLANAFATGALSGPHDRYQARIAWLLLLPAAFAVRQEERRGLCPIGANIARHARA